MRFPLQGKATGTCVQALPGCYYLFGNIACLAHELHLLRMPICRGMLHTPNKLCCFPYRAYPVSGCMHDSREACGTARHCNTQTIPTPHWERAFLAVLMPLHLLKPKTSTYSPDTEMRIGQQQLPSSAGVCSNVVINVWGSLRLGACRWLPVHRRVRLPLRLQQTRNDTLQVWEYFAQYLGCMHARTLQGTA